MLQAQKLLVTGVTGNLGGSLAAALAPHNEVWTLGRFGKPGQREFWNGKGLHTVVGDLANPPYEGLPDDFDYVIHCAANCNPDSFEQGMRDNPEASALLMTHCRKAKGFLHISTVGVYAPTPDPLHQQEETDLTGGCAMLRHYEGTKLAAEGAVRATARLLNLPTIICRLGVQYGVYKDGGMLGIFLKMLLAGRPIPLPKGRGNVLRPISDDDVVEFLEPLLKAAAVPPPTVNLAGDEDMPTVEIMEHFGRLAGVKPTFASENIFEYPTLLPSFERRRAITGPCKVPLREGLTRMYEQMHERLRAELASAA